jgi:hypothetical protein
LKTEENNYKVKQYTVIQQGKWEMKLLFRGTENVMEICIWFKFKSHLTEAMVVCTPCGLETLSFYHCIFRWRS